MTPPYDLTIPGWMDENELQWLYATALTMSSVVELGCYQGRSTFALLQGCPGIVIAVDTWVDIMGTGANNLALFIRNLQERGAYLDSSCIMPMTSAEAAEPGRVLNQVDMVFVDADHLEAGLALDLQLWTPKAQKLICGHDYGNPDWPDVKTVVDRVFGSRVTNPTGLIWAVPVV